jgi:anaerobic selenocysteine-containing dehydrogenase
LRLDVRQHPILPKHSFYRGNSARNRVWNTKSGKAEFTAPEHLSATGFEEADGWFRLITLRSNDQFNTTIYGFSDRMRGIEGTRDVLLINPQEIKRLGLEAGQEITLASDAGDEHERKVVGLKVTPFDLPDGCVAGYYPELNPLIALDHHDVQSKTPAYKSVPVRIIS